MQFAYTLDLSLCELKAWSQNLGHEEVLTSLTSYGHLSVLDQGEAFRGIRASKAPAGPATPLAERSEEELLRELLRRKGQAADGVGG